MRKLPGIKPPQTSVVAGSRLCSLDSAVFISSLLFLLYLSSLSSISYSTVALTQVLRIQSLHGGIVSAICLAPNSTTRVHHAISAYREGVFDGLKLYVVDPQLKPGPKLRDGM